MDPLGTAEPGERYQVVSTDSGWALAVRAGDAPDRAVWITLDDRVQAPGLIANRLQETLLGVGAIAAAIGVTLLLYYGISSRLQARSRNRAARRRAAANATAKETANGNGRLPTAS